MERRSFLKIAGGLATGYAIGVRPAIAADEAVEKVNGLPRRVLGRTGEKVSVVGFPGLSLRHYEQDECNRGLVSAFEKGLNYYDVAPAYGRDGECEIKMGIGLQALDRSKYFLACKTKMRDKDGCRMELERSLQRLKTDHFDLYQMHCLRTPEEVKQTLGPGGAMETILKAKEQGKIRFIGFSAHTTKGAVEALNGFNFDTCMFPINFVEFYKIGFGKEVLKVAAGKGTAVIAIKPLSKGPWPQGMDVTRKWWYRCTEAQEEANAAMNWTLSRRGVVAGIPPSFLDLLDRAIEAGKSYRRITREEAKTLRQTADTCLSLFEREEAKVARGEQFDKPVYPDSPHECCRMTHA